MTSLQEISNLIFVSSWAHSVHELPKRFVASEPQIDVLLSSKSPKNSVGHILHECLDPDQSMNDLLSNSKRLQQHLIDKVTKAQVSILLDKESEKDQFSKITFLARKRCRLLAKCHSISPESRNLTWKFPLGGIHEVGNGDALAFVGR